MILKHTKMNNHYIILRNEVKMPLLIQGLIMICGFEKLKIEKFHNIMSDTISTGIYGFDTSHDYGKSELFIGKSLDRLLKERVISRDDLFIQSKIGNEQQYLGNIEDCVDEALKKLHIDYLDLMLLHWPTPDFYVENWKKLEQVYQKGKIKAIGIANVQIRHLEALIKHSCDILPHVIQTEIHPLYINDDLLNYCVENNIVVQACTPLCCMIDMIRHNPILIRLAQKYNRSIAQIILRWHYQRNTIIVFRAYNKTHMEETANIFDFSLENDEIIEISSLNCHYRYHPESLNCPAY